MPVKEDIEPIKNTEEIPTLAEFVPKFREAYIHANRLKPSSRSRWDDARRLDILPILGSRPINRIGAAEFQRLKLQPFAANTISGLIGNLMTILRAARDRGYEVVLPRVKLVKVPARGSRSSTTSTPTADSLRPLGHSTRAPTRRRWTPRSRS